MNSQIKIVRIQNKITRVQNKQQELEERLNKQQNKLERDLKNRYPGKSLAQKRNFLRSDIKLIQNLEQRVDKQQKKLQDTVLKLDNQVNRKENILKFIEDSKKTNNKKVLNQIQTQIQDGLLLEEVTNSMGIKELIEHYNTDDFITQSEKNDFASNLWRQFGNSNNNFISESQLENFYIPSNGACLFKCLIKIMNNIFIDDKDSRDETIQYIENLQQQKYFTVYKQGVSSKQCILILNEIKEKFDVDIIFNTITAMRDNHLKKSEHILTLIENHYVYVQQYNQKKDSESLMQVQKILEDSKNNNYFITQEHINGMISKQAFNKKKENTNVQTEKKEQKIEQNVNIYISDIESRQIQGQKQIPFLIGYNKIKTQRNIQSNVQTTKAPKFEENENPYILIDTFLTSVFNDMRKDKIKTSYMYYHNGKNYDNLILFKYMNKEKFHVSRDIQMKGNSMIFNITYRKNNNKKDIEYTLRLLDSQNIVNGSLKKLCVDFKTQSKKLDSTCIANIQTYQQYIDNRRTILEYYFMDTQSLQEIIQKVRNFFIGEYQIDILSQCTIGQISQNIYKQKYNPQYEGQQFFFDNVQMNEYLRLYIYGGRTVCKQQNFKQENDQDYLAYIDANSLYPSAMMKLEKFFILDNKAIQLNVDQIMNLEDKLNGYKNQRNFEYLNEFYLIDCNIQIPEQSVMTTNYMRYNNKKGDLKTGYCTGNFEQQHLSSWDLIQLIMYNGAQVQIFNAVKCITQVDNKHKQMMSELKSKRDCYKQQKNDTAQQMIKCIMNSKYGKDIQKPCYDKSQYLSGQKDEKRNKLIKQRFDIKDKDGNLEKYSIYNTQKIDLEQQMNCSCISFGIQILALSKIMMNEVIDKVDGFGNDDPSNVIYYSDTDSIIISKQQYEQLIKNNKEIIGNEFGQFKLEHKLKQFSSYGKKMYEYVDYDDNTYDFRLKGVSFKRNVDNSLTEQSIIEGRSIFETLNQNKVIKREKLQFLRDMRSQTIEVKQQLKTIQSTYEQDCKLINNIYYPQVI